MVSNGHVTLEGVLYCDCRESNQLTDKSAVTAMNRGDCSFSEIDIPWRQNIITEQPTTVCISKKYLEYLLLCLPLTKKGNVAS